MDPKTVDFTGQKILASQIADFYTRLNNLRSLNGGSTTVSFSAPTIGNSVTPTTINEAKDAVLATKSALTFLASIDISSWSPTVPNQGELIESKNTVAAIEWQIGQLENACFTNFAANRSGVNVSNFTNFNLAPTVSFTSNNTTVHATFGTICTTQKSVNFNPNTACGTVFTPHFASVNTPYGCGGADFAPNHTNKTAFFVNYTAFQTVHSAKRVSVCTGQNQNCLTYGTNFNNTHYVTHKSTQRSTNFTTQFLSQNAANFSNVCGVNVCNAVHASVCATVHSTVFSAQHTAFFGTHCLPVHSNFGCQTVHTSVKSTNKASNCTGNNSANFSPTGATYFTNHSSFTVLPTL